MHRHNLLFSGPLSVCLKPKDIIHNIEPKQLKQTAHHAYSPLEDLSSLTARPPTKPRPQLARRLRLAHPSRGIDIPRPHPGAPIPLLASPARRCRDRRRAVALLHLPALQCADTLHWAVSFQTSNMCALRRDSVSWLSDERGPVPAAVGLGACAACVGGQGGKVSACMYQVWVESSRGDGGRDAGFLWSDV